MNIIAIESSTEQCSVALDCGNQTRQLISDRPREHAERALPMIESLLAEAGIARNQLDLVVFGQGPGSFTGVRVACSVAQGLGYGLDIPVLPISSLAALAQATVDELSSTGDPQPGYRVIAAQDARLSEIYVGVYQFTATNLCQPAADADVDLDIDKVMLPTDFAGQFQADGQQWIAAGNAWQVYQQQLAVISAQSVSRQIDHCQPNGLALLKLAHNPVYQHRAVSAELAQPVYVRDQVTHRK